MDRIARAGTPTADLSAFPGRILKSAGALVVLAAFTALALLPISAQAQPAVDPHAKKAVRGEFGADLRELARFYTPPQREGESNHYFEMWEGQNLRAITRSSDLPDNHALFVNSHGKAIPHKWVMRHAYYPHDSLLSKGKAAPYFSVQDLATVLGKDAAHIHNIIVAGCDNDLSFSASELRQYFVNATNITHVLPGTSGYQPMYLQAILTPSRQIQPLYETGRLNFMGVTEYQITQRPSPNAIKLNPYIAELYQPGATISFRTQIAGRELLDPPQATLSLAGVPPQRTPGQALSMGK